jgi:hypothetical protein
MYYPFQTKLLDLKQLNYSIMKAFYTLLILLIPFVGYGQNNNEEIKKLTKMDLFTSKTGSIIKYIDFSLDDIKGNYSNGETRVRKVISGESTGYFFQISKTGKYSTKTASIEYSDLIEIIRAFNLLKESSFSDIMTKGNYLENKFITDDGFEIGYYVKNENAIWYISLEKYGSDNSIFVRDINALENSFVQAKNKIEYLKKN